MTRPLLFLVLFFWFCLVSAAAGSDKPLIVDVRSGKAPDETIRAKAGSSEIVITTTNRLAGAIHSLRWNGKEFIDSHDHGRQLQSAASFDCGLPGEFWAERFNPTEAGSRADGTGMRSSSKLLHIETNGRELQSTTRMAFWLAPGEKSEGRTALNDTILSRHHLSKRVVIGYRNLANVIEYDVTFSVPQGERHTLGQFEALTGYMPSEFSRFWKFVPVSGRLEKLDDGPGEQEYPVVFSTEDGKYAMGVFSPDQPSRGYEKLGYGRFRFPAEKVVKWNCVFRVREARGIPTGDYRYRLFVAVGTLDDVRQALGSLIKEDEADRLRVGLQPDGRIVVPTNQILKPAGTQVTFPGRPVDLALAEDEKILVIKNKSDLVFVDTATAKIKQTLKSPVGFSAVGLLLQGNDVYVTDVANTVRLARRSKDGTYGWVDGISLEKPKTGGVAYPTGMWWADTGSLFVASNRGNSVQRINLGTGKVEQVIPVGVAPYTIRRPRPDRCFVSNWGSDLPGKDDPRALSSGTAVRIDERTGIANQGTVSVLEQVAGKWQQRKSIRVGLHPSGMINDSDGAFLYIANANSDSVSVINTLTDEVVETISCRPEARLPFGSGSNALAISPNGGTLYVANGTNNCIAVVLLGKHSTVAPGKRPERSVVVGLIPTGWYPGSVVLSRDGKKLYVANVKGIGALSQPRPVEKGKNSHDHLGSVSIIDVPDEKQLATYTALVHANNRLAYSLAGLEKPRPDARPVPVPRRHGEPSLFKHVIYVIKENRTYDQVFGDMKEGNGDAGLAIFGEKVTPNHHALAREFTLFDNFYCSGVLSADGHQWVNEAYVTDYLEKAFGKFVRSYPFEGSDPLAFAASGFLWDNALARRRRFRNYGEFVKMQAPRGMTWTDAFADYTNRTAKFTFDVKANVKTLEPYTRAGYPGFVMSVPDVYRARIFIDDLKEYERKGDLPNLVYLYLPCDHTSGTSPGWPTPAAMLADNDLALGQVVEAVSRSKFWKDTCIFVVEDDPQNGFDHVDGHRTVALAISPNTRRKFVDHTCYNQTGMVKTIELILGLPPMNQLDLSATPMRNCFQDRAELTPYTCRPNQVPLDQMNPPLKKLRGQALHWAKKSLALDFTEADNADEDTLNRILWHAMRGDKVPYPEAFVGK